MYIIDLCVIEIVTIYLNLSSLNFDIHIFYPKLLTINTYLLGTEQIVKLTYYVFIVKF